MLLFEIFKNVTKREKLLTSQRPGLGFLTSACGEEFLMFNVLDSGKRCHLLSRSVPISLQLGVENELDDFVRNPFRHFFRTPFFRRQIFVD